MVQVDFVSDENDWHVFGGLDAANLLPHLFDVEKALHGDDGEDEDESLSVADVEVPHRGELLRPRRVQNLQRRRSPFHLNLFPIKV